MLKFLTKRLVTRLMAAFFVLSLHGFANAEQQFVLVTDVDDTIKVSHVVDTISKVIRFLAEPEAFAGMSELYDAMLSDAKTRGLRSNFIVLSGTPSLLASSVLDFLSVFRFPEPLSVITRPMFMDTEEFKIEAVTTIIGHPVMRGASVILIGDDTEHDYAAYSKSIAAQGATPIFESQIYIRRVTGAANTSASSIAFDSAADIAVVEYLKGRLTEAAAERILTLVEKENTFERLFVPGEYCPDAKSTRISTHLKSSKAPESLVRHLVRVENHLRERCSSLNAFIAGILE